MKKEFGKERFIYIELVGIKWKREQLILGIYRKLKMIESSMVTKEELSRVLESAIIFSNEDTMRQIEESEKDIRSGRIKKINSVNDIE